MIFRKRKFARIAAAALVLIALTVLQLTGLTGLPERVFGQALRPVLLFGEYLAKPFVYTGRLLFTVRSVLEENDQLKARIQDLEVQVAGTERLLQENNELKRNLAFADRPMVRLLPCTALTRDPHGLTDAMLIFCPSADPLQVGQAVVGSGYLVGKVVLVSGSTVTVRLITAPNSVIDARIAGKEYKGVVRGVFGSGLNLDFISPTSDVNAGDTVLTAGISDLVPPELPIGSVVQVKQDPGALFQSIVLASGVDLSELRFVYVVANN